MSKRSRYKRRKHGQYAGWGLYRYGGSDRPITLAGPQPEQRIYRGQKRKHVVGKMMDAMRDWRVTPFENEGYCVAGFRAALCIDGHGWNEADREAYGIVGEALHMLGAKRPSYEQAQREYTTPRENCAWCGGLIPDDLLLGGERRTYSYCSAVCARAAIEQRNLSRRRHETRAFVDAWDIIQRSESPTQSCAWCGNPYRPLFGKGKYCGLECAAKARESRPMVECAHCGKPFPARLNHGRRAMFCNAGCKYLHGFSTRYSKTCVVCGDPFEAKVESALTCSKACKSFHDRFVAGTPPKRITPRVFDYMVRMAA